MKQIGYAEMLVMPVSPSPKSLFHWQPRKHLKFAFLAMSASPFGCELLGCPYQPLWGLAVCIWTPVVCLCCGVGGLHCWLYALHRGFLKISGCLLVLLDNGFLVWSNTALIWPYGFLIDMNILIKYPLSFCKRERGWPNQSKALLLLPICYARCKI